MRTTNVLLAAAAAAILAAPAAADEVAVKITADLAAVEVMHGGEKVVIQRNQDEANTVNPAFAKTSRKCPPFCIQPTRLAPGVDTIGEDEVIRYAKMMSDGDSSIVLIDSRTPDWVGRGTIPSAINQPWTLLDPAKGADPISISEIMENVFNVKSNEELMDFSECKTAVMFCNGMWCGQSPNNIRNLLKFGYPSHKIKWYRGGMQDWEILGLTTVKGG